MKHIILLAVSAVLAGCSPFEPAEVTLKREYVEQAAKYEQRAKEDALIVKQAVDRGDLKLSLEYLLPNLSSGRWFKVEDQYGCKWWIDSGHKFDHEQLDVVDKDTANCPSEDVAPDPETVYRDREGKLVNIYDFVNATRRTLQKAGEDPTHAS